MPPFSEPSSSPKRLGRPAPEVVVGLPPGSSGKEPPVILRETMIRLTYQCPKDGYVLQCPFKTLATLSHCSRLSLLDRLDAEKLLGMFDLAAPCVCLSDPRLGTPTP